MRPCPSPVLALLAAILCPGCGNHQSVPAPGPEELRPTLEMPAPLEAERAAYEAEVAKALADVRECFRSAGLQGPGRRPVDAVTVFASSGAARTALAGAYGVAVDSIPETFSGTVVENRLFLVSRPAYEEIWRSLYPEWPWEDRSYHALIVHELAHRAHELWAIAQRGSADAMGPTWFFEGFAVMCARQFQTDEAPLDLEDLRRLVGAGHVPEVSYPLYGRIVRSLAARYGMSRVIALAAEPRFPDRLLEPQALSEPAR